MKIQKKVDKSSSAGTEDESSTNSHDKQVSQPIAKPNVSSRLSYQEFFYAMQHLKDFFKEQQKLNDVLHVISPTGTSIVEFGNKFVDDFIEVVESALGDRNNFVSWFVFENDFGKKKLEAGEKGNLKKICNESQFYKMVTGFKN